MEKHVMMGSTRPLRNPMPDHLGPQSDQPVSHVESAMTRIGSLINQLEAIRQTMESRLNPILAQVPTGNDQLKDKETGYSSPLVGELQTFANKLERIIGAFGEMESRIEL